MPASCVILDCNLKYTHSEDVSFHKFPLKQPDLLKQWMQFTGRDESWFPTKWSAICSRHFLASELRGGPFRKMLLATAVPSIRSVPEKERSVYTSLITAYEPIPPDEIPFRDEDYLRDELDGSSITHCSTAGVAEHMDDELQDYEIQLTEITCRICGVVFSRAVDNILLDLSQFEVVVERYLPFVNLSLPNLPRKVCLNCSKVVDGFSKFCDNMLRAQADLEHRFAQRPVRVLTPAPTTTALRTKQEGVAGKPMNIKQEPITMLHIKEEKIESANSGGRQKESATSEPFEDSAMVMKNQSIGGEQNRIILFNGGSDRSNCSTTSSLVKQQLRESSKNCEILEIVNLYPPIVDITSTTITEVQPYEITAPPAVTATAAESFASLQYPALAAQFMGSLKVEKTTEQESEQEDYYLRDTLALINTLEEHSYTKLPFQADDNKDEIFHSISAPSSSTESVVGGEEQKNEAQTGASWACADCGRSCSHRRRLLCHKALECPARRKLSVCCQFCRHKFPSWQRARAHVAVCLKRAARRKRSNVKSILDRSKHLVSRALTDGFKLPCRDELVITRYTCSLCDRSYSNSSNLRRHLATHRPPEQWNHKCGVCFKIFDKLFDLKKHLQISPCTNGHQLATDEPSTALPPDGDHPLEERGEVESSASIISSVPVTNATNHATDRLLYVCSTCNKHFRSYNNLKVHEPIHTGAKAFICETCGKRFAGQTNLWQHRFTHSELRQFRCKLCPKVFKRRGGLTQHVRAFHMKIKPYQCSTCGYEYALKADMTRCRHSRLKYVESC